jgi:hypothetical protein
MKKLQYFPIFSLLIVTMLTVSCSKESSNLGSGLTPTPVAQLPETPLIGSMVDLGLINSNARAMFTTVNTQSFTVNTNDAVVGGTAAMINLTYYVSSDAQIPAGEYTFAASDSKSPFTFDSAFFGSAIDNNGNDLTGQRIIDGSVVVTQNGSSYHFDIQGHLESGAMFAGSSDGTLSYKDSNNVTY